MGDINALVVFYSRYGTTEKLALAAGLGAIQADANIRLRRVADHADAASIAADANWKKNLDSASIAKFQRELGAMGYKFQFVTLAGFHALNASMFNLARDYRDRGMAAYAVLQEAEFAAEGDGYSATKHQREVGTGYFDLVAQIIAVGKSSTAGLDGSTEAEQFR